MSAYVSVFGRLVHDPRVHTFETGKTKAHFNVACNYRQRKKDGSYENKAMYFDVDVYDERGEKLAAHLAKGSRIFVAGELQERQYTHQGETKRGMTIRFPQIKLVDTKQESDALLNQRQGNYAEPDGNRIDGEVPF